MYKIFVGIDVSLDSFNVAILDNTENVITTFKLKQDIKGFQKLQSTLIGLAPKLLFWETIAKEIAKLKTQIKQLVFNLFDERGRRLKLTADDVIEIANNTISIDDINREIVLKSRIRRLLYLEEEIKVLTEELLSKMQFFRPIEMKIVKSIPGIGEICATVFLAEIQDIYRFSNSHKKLIAYAGLDPIVLQSGKFKGKFTISKRVNPHLRRAWSMTLGTIFSTHRFKRYYKMKRFQGMSHKKAVIATSNKLIRILFFLLSNGTPFQDVHIITPNCS